MAGSHINTLFTGYCGYRWGSLCVSSTWQAGSHSSYFSPSLHASVGVVSVCHCPLETGGLPFLLPVTSRMFSTVELVISKAEFSLGTVLYQDCQFPYSWWNSPSDWEITASAPRGKIAASAPWAPWSATQIQALIFAHPMKASEACVRVARLPSTALCAPSPGRALAHGGSHFRFYQPETGSGFCCFFIFLWLLVRLDIFFSV